MEQKEFEVMLADAEVRLKRLRTLYEQYFQGIERLEPLLPKRDLDHIISALRRGQPNNTALRFRFNQVVQRYTTYNTYWRRISRQIEEGTYKRDVLRARRITQQKPSDDDRPKNQPYELDMEADFDIDAALDAVMKKSDPPANTSGAATGNGGKEISRFAHPSDKPPKAAQPGGVRSFPAPPGARPRPPTPPPVRGKAGANRPPPPPVPGKAPARRPAASGGGNVSDAEIARLHQRYLAARKQNSERTDNVKVESIAKTVRTMMPKLQKKHGGKKIDFEVVVKNGKVALKPVAK